MNRTFPYRKWGFSECSLPGFVNDGGNPSTGWKPIDLPQTDIQISRMQP